MPILTLGCSWNGLNQASKIVCIVQHRARHDLVLVARGCGVLRPAIAAIPGAQRGRIPLVHMHARRDELDIMQLVGAPQIYIRGPFVMEGTLQGGLAAIVAVAGLGITFLALRATYLAPLAATINLSSVRFLPLDLCLWLIVGGMAVGCLGGLVATAGRA